MNQSPLSTRLVIAGIMTLLTASLAGFSGLVLCVGTDGHRAVEPEHATTGCPTLASSQGTLGISVQPPAECFDFPTAGAGLAALASSDAERVPVPPMVFLPARLEPARRVETPLSASTDPRAGPPNLAPHLTSTVLLV